MANQIKYRLRRDDEVVVIAGRDKGLRGKILRMLPEKGRAVVSKVNMIKRHVRPTQNNTGGIIEREAAIELSNLQYYCPACKKGVRLGVKTLEDDRKVRVCKACNEVLDN